MLIDAVFFVKSWTRVKGETGQDVVIVGEIIAVGSGIAELLAFGITGFAGIKTDDISSAAFALLIAN